MRDHREERTSERNSSAFVTPRSQTKYEMISANIRAKATTYVDIQFTGANAQDGGRVDFDRISKLSFDLAIFGDLGSAV